MKRKLTIILTLFALLFGTANAQVVFDPATYPADSLEAGYTLDTIDGEVYLQVILNGWNSSIPLYEDVIIANGRSEFSCMVKYSVGTSGVHPDTIQSFVQLMTSSWGDKVAATGPASADFVKIKKDGLASGRSVGRIQFAGQEKLGGWPALVGDTLWVGKIVAENPNAILDPLLVPADTLPTNWTLDTIDGEVYFRVITQGWGGSWEFHKDIGTRMVPGGVTAFKAMTKYVVGTSGIHPDTIQAFVQPITPDWGTKFPATGLALDSLTKVNAAIPDSTVLGVLQVTGQQKLGGWPALEGDTVWVGIIEAEFIDSLVLSSEGGASTIDVDKDTLDLTAQIYPMDFPNTAVTWSISDDSLATVSSGMVIAKDNGMVKVYVVSDDNPAFNDSIEITITNQVPAMILVDSILISSAGDAVTIDTDEGTLQFSAMIYPEDADDTTHTWMVTPEGFATIDTDGLLTAVADGMVTVTAKANDPGGVVSSGIEVTITNQVPVESIAVIGAGSVSEITDVGGTLVMFAAVLPEDASNKDLTWSVSDELIATISAEGLLTAVSDGVVTVTATADDGSGVTGSTDITISGQSINVEDVADNSIVVFPNPVTNTLFIENAESFTSFEILNMDGKLMMRVLNTGDRMSIDVSGLSNGMYIIRGYQADQIQTIKLIK